MLITLGGWNCLFVSLCLIAGCWDSHPKQEAGTPANSSAAAANSGQATVANPHDELGFTHTLGPDSNPGSKPESKPLSSSAPTAALSGAKNDRYPDVENRYAGSVPAPAVGNRAAEIPSDPPAYVPRPAETKPLPPQPIIDPPSGPAKMAESSPRAAAEAKPARPAAADGPAGSAPAIDPKPAAGGPLVDPHREASPIIDPPPEGNPLRDPSTAIPNSAVPTQPDPPPFTPQPGPTPAPANASHDTPPQPSAGPQAAPSVEMVIQTKPDESSPVQVNPSPNAQPNPIPATPLAAQPAVPGVLPGETSPGKKPQPKEHSLESDGVVPKTAKNSGVPFEPVKVNGPIFLDPNGVPWPTPKLALVITGNQEGYLEPCGCAGLDRMKGGMSRRYTLFRDLREKEHWPVVGLDVGNIAKGFGKQAELKFQIAVNAMNEMKYSCVALGQTDLYLPTAEVMALTMPADAQKKTMFVSGNVGLFDFNEQLLPCTHLIHAGFKTIGVTSVLGKTYSARLAGNTDLKMISPEKLLDKAVPMLKKSANYLVLLAHTEKKEAVELAQRYPDFNLVVCSDGGAEPPNNFEEIGKGGTKLVVVGEKGMYAVVLGLYDDPRQPVRYQRVTLDSRFRSSPEMVALMSAYQDQLKGLGLSGLGIRPLPNPLKETNGDYVGSEACKSCHEESYRVWKKSPHSRAFATLKNAVPPRNFDPECVSCHTVGWNPSKFFPYESGYLSEKESPKLVNVGCEDCHGPGQKHCRAENQGTPAEQALYRKTSVITKEEAADPNSRKTNCWSCHDQDNSPEFKFDLYWPYVKHYERE